MKKAAALLLSFILFVSLAVSALSAGFGGEVSAGAALLFNRDTGDVLYSKNSTGSISAGNSALLMAALVAAENCADPEALFSVNMTADAEESVILRNTLAPPLTEGEHVTMRQLLTAVLLTGADDAAMAIARKIGGSAVRFVALMNARAAELGMYDTCYVNPNGAEVVTEEQTGAEIGKKKNQDGEYTTVADVKKLTEAVLKNELLYGILRLSGTVFADTDRASARSLKNSNQLVPGDDNQSAFADKTVLAGFGGYSAQAGLVTVATREEITLVCIMMDDGAATPETRFSDTESLLNFLGGETEMVNIAELLQNVPLAYSEGDSGTFIVTPSFPEGEVELPTDYERSSVTAQVVRSGAGSTVGTAYYYGPDGEALAAVPVTIERIRSAGEERGRRFFGWGIALLTVFLVITLIAAFRQLYGMYRYQQNQRTGNRLEGSPEKVKNTQIAQNAFNRTFPLWALFAVALVLLVVLVLCFRIYKN